MPRACHLELQSVLSCMGYAAGPTCCEWAAIPKDVDASSITLEQAVALLDATIPQSLGSHPDDGAPILVKSGRLRNGAVMVVYIVCGSEARLSNLRAWKSFIRLNKPGWAGCAPANASLVSTVCMQ
eukprot:scaffold252112_cov21-Tisochrysis_lutea.AAC.2